MTTRTRTTLLRDAHFVGTLTRDFITKEVGGKTLASSAIAMTERVRDTDGTYKNGETVFVDVVCWDFLAKDAAVSLVKGDRVVIIGRLAQQTYTDKDGAPQTKLEITIDEIAKSVRFAAKSAPRMTKTLDTSDWARVDDDEPF